MIECTTKPEKVNSGPLRLSHLITGYYVGYCEKACGFSVWCQPEFNPPPGLPVLSRLCSWSIASRADDERSLDASKKKSQLHTGFFLHACRSTRMRQDILEGGPHHEESEFRKGFDLRGSDLRSRRRRNHSAVANHDHRQGDWRGRQADWWRVSILPRLPRRREHGAGRHLHNPASRGSRKGTDGSAHRALHRLLAVSARSNAHSRHAGTELLVDA